MIRLGRLNAAAPVQDRAQQDYAGERCPYFLRVLIVYCDIVPLSTIYHDSNLISGKYQNWNVNII